MTPATTPGTEPDRKPPAPSCVAGPSDGPLLDTTIGQALRLTTERHGGRDAIVSVFQRQALSYAGLDLAADLVAGALLARGIRPGDRVAIWSANRIEWLIAHHGAVRIGAIVVTVNPAFRNEELAYILEDSGARLLFAAPGFRSFSFTAAVAAVRPRLPALETVVVFGDDAPEGMESWTGFLDRDADPAAVRAAEAAVAADDPCSLQYTSGTTGRPKGALLTHRNILNNGYFVGLRQHLGPKDRICLPVPFFHCFGVVLGGLAALVHGSALVLPGESFDPIETLAAIAAERCTALYGVPMMFIALQGHPEFGRHDLSTLRTGCMGAAPCPLKTMTDAVERMHMRQITVVYGMTETSPISFQSLSSDDLETRISTVGAIQPHLEAKVVDPVTGRTVERGQRGELCVRGYSVMRGYWQRPEATAEAIDAEGWMHSGDLAVMDGRGYVQIVGRLKDTIIRGGENVYPREIEEFLLTLAPVAEAYVFGLPDERYGEEVCAWIRLRPGAETDAEALRELCRGRIATYKIPRSIRFVEAFPATASGKVQKFRMREEELALRGEAPEQA
ncbi:fatty-acyl-CoA synthase [Tistlia consotensis]|uniref:3-methylmercaptopropionyl-CoA ligase n=1 Tax=Tistlia consotensis USBA 355 TaxID=560819 RepID=A0A1Y6CFH8_9PROT|nr:AMP-binding protein [Tistlia consotensis]SMF58641.1 fatty-acyl-CoA synthase [Tistlia consotensis USBA 355]SNR63468.1 fatty-acyl-CoA synthase [Tistlia consotensis]